MTDPVTLAERHLSQNCPVMAQLVTAHRRCEFFDREIDPFRVMVNSIISQQLSTKAADTIGARVSVLVPDGSPGGFLRVSAEDLRAAGLSGAKTRYIQELARRIDQKLFDFAELAALPDAEVIAALTTLPGIGRWTAEMFLIFGLRRPDVLALGDAGLQRAARLLYGQDAVLSDVATPWAPHRSVASWYLWRHLDVVPKT